MNEPVTKQATVPAPVLTTDQRVATLEKDLADLKKKLAKKIAFL